MLFITTQIIGDKTRGAVFEKFLIARADFARKAVKHWQFIP